MGLRASVYVMFIESDDNKLQDEPMVDLLYTHIFPMRSLCTCVACQVYKYIHILSTFVNTHMHAPTYTPGRGKIVPRNVTLLVGEKLCRVM